MKDSRRLLSDAAKARYRTLRAWWFSRSLRPHGAFHLSPEERQAAAAVSVVVAVHDAPEVTARCLNSLEQFAQGAEVIIVDDASQLDAARKLLDAACSRNQWKLIRNGTSLGHSRASEAGVAVSSRPYVCLLNSDTVVTPRSWAGVVDAFESSSRVAIAGPATSYTAGAQQVNGAYHCRHYWSDAQIWCFAEKYVTQHRHEPIVDSSFVGGFAFFVRRTTWNELNGFDTNLPDYGNESEFCQRAIRTGSRAVFTRRGYIHHLGNISYGGSLGQAAVQKRRLRAKSYIDNKHSNQGLR